MSRKSISATTATALATVTAAVVGLGLAAAASTALAGTPYTQADFARIYAGDTAAYTSNTRHARGGIDTATGRAWDEIDRRGAYRFASDEQIVIAQRARAETLRRIAEQAYATGAESHATWRLKAAAAERTATIQVAAFTGTAGDGTVRLAQDGTVTLQVSGLTFTTPETRTLAAVAPERRVHVATLTD